MLTEEHAKRQTDLNHSIHRLQMFPIVCKHEHNPRVNSFKKQSELKIWVKQGTTWSAGSFKYFELTEINQRNVNQGEPATAALTKLIIIWTNSNIALPE